MAVAGFKGQANALVRKSLVFQKRNVNSNICLLSAPIFFAIILLIIKLLVNNVFLAGPEFKCGCQCLRCVRSNDSSIAFTGLGTVPGANDGKLLFGYCSDADGYKCDQFNNSACSLDFSGAQQAQYCAINNPSSWPPVINVPENQVRAGAQPNRRNPAIMPITAVTNSQATLFGSQMFSPPDLSRLAALTNLSYSANDTTIYEAYKLAQLGFQFGTSSEDSLGLYVEQAFIQDGLYALLPQSQCTALGLTGRFNIRNFLEAYATATGASAADQTAIAALPSTSSINQITFECVDAPTLVQGGRVDLDNELYCGYKQARCNGLLNISEYTSAWDFRDSTSSRFAPVYYYNSTMAEDEGQGPPRVQRQPGVLNQAVRAWWNAYASGNQSAIQLLGVMSYPKEDSKLSLDFSTLLGPLFYTWVVQLLLPTFLQQLVYEKEKRLRMMMKMHGLGDGAYWLITYLWYLLLYIIYMIIFIVAGVAVGLDLFRRTNMGITIIFYFLFGNCMIAFAFMLSSFFTSARTVVVVAFVYIIATGLIGFLLLEPFMEKDKSWLFFVEWIPAWSLYRGIWEMSSYTFLGVYTNTRGMDFNTLTDSGNGMRTTWGIFVVEWLLFLVLGWYFEKVLSSGTGVRQHPLFFLECFGYGKKAKAAEHQAVEMSLRSEKELAEQRKNAITLAGAEPQDVYDEHMRVQAMTDYSDTPIVVKDLKKVFPGLDGGKPKLAVKQLTLGVERGECFGLLGPNGAGKSTAIGMLTGFLEPSHGTSIIEGYNLAKDMNQVYQIMGVCPQHDLLWEQLTGREHLLFYGRLKGLKGQPLTDSVEKALRSVNLWNGGVADKLAGKYSGGMKRRLSVAISFMGDPKVVYLDEPSTGLDPASRRKLWEVVKDNKRGRSIILTTHSMEEAEVLCDRLGIFVDGELVCIGAPKEITSRYAGYLVFTISVPPSQEVAAKALVASMSPNARLTYELAGTLKYELPSEDISLSGVFAAMNAAKTQNRVMVLDWGVANATLEEVFIKFARAMGMQAKDA